MNTCSAGDHELKPETEIAPRQRLWLEMKLCESLHGARTSPLVGGLHLVITMRLTNKSKSNHGQILEQTIYFLQ